MVSQKEPTLRSYVISRVSSTYITYITYSFTTGHPIHQTPGLNPTCVGPATGWKATYRLVWWNEHMQHTQVVLKIYNKSYVYKNWTCRKRLEGLAKKEAPNAHTINHTLQFSLWECQLRIFLYVVSMGEVLRFAIQCLMLGLNLNSYFGLARINNHHFTRGPGKHGWLRISLHVWHTWTALA